MFEIKVKYVETTLKNGKKSVVVLKDEEAAKRHAGSLIEITTQWTQPNWKQSQDMIRAATSFDHIAGDRVTDWNFYRAMLLENCMKMWDIKIGDQAVPCTVQNISRLDPSVAYALVSEFIAKTQPSEDELKN